LKIKLEEYPFDLELGASREKALIINGCNKDREPLEEMNA
jgi:hypothetical protein